LGEEETWESGRRREEDNTVLGFGNVSEELRTCMVHTVVGSGFNSSKCIEQFYYYAYFKGSPCTFS
jgi:hypothetical protein